MTDERDALDEQIEERTRRNPDYPRILAEAQAARKAQADRVARNRATLATDLASGLETDFGFEPEEAARAGAFMAEIVERFLAQDVHAPGDLAGSLVDVIQDAIERAAGGDVVEGPTTVLVVRDLVVEHVVPAVKTWLEDDGAPTQAAAGGA